MFQFLIKLRDVTVHMITLKHPLRPTLMPFSISGITPMLQLIRSITADPTDNTKCSLIFANQVSFVNRFGKSLLVILYGT